jgi:hypothetical protein
MTRKCGLSDVGPAGWGKGEPGDRQLGKDGVVYAI